jgi:circadian clock protein KaiC
VIFQIGSDFSFALVFIDLQEKPIMFKKIETGISGFDEIALGGLPKNRTTLVAGTSGSGKTVFSIEYIYRGITMFKEPGIIVTFEESKEEIIDNTVGFGWNLEQLERDGMLGFVDLSQSLGEEEIVGNYDLTGLIERVKLMALRVQAVRATLDAVSALFINYTNSHIVRKDLFRLSSALKKMGVTPLITSERIEEQKMLSRFQIEEFTTDNVILLYNPLQNSKRARHIEILKFRGTQHETGLFPITIDENGIHITSEQVLLQS